MDESRGAGQLERLRGWGSDAGHDAAGPDAARGDAAGDSALISFESVGHVYRSIFGRSIRALEGFSLTIRESEVFGLAGPNGAGKSTLISLLLGYLEPTEGSIRISGMKPRAFVERHGIGYLSELVAIPPRWTLDEALQRYAILAGIPTAEVRARTARVVELLGLGEQRGKRVKQLSKGNLQRLGLAQALLREDRVIILDEPTHGLDPVWTQRFRDVVDELRRPHRAIFIASHNLDELQRLADRVAIIDRGRLQRLVEPRAAESGELPYRITVVGDDGVLLEIFPAAQKRGPGEFEIPVVELSRLNAGLAELLRRGVLVSNLHPAHSVLEQHFRQAVSE
jgi:ABC-type multidrug transport system ATPase subunit